MPCVCEKTYVSVVTEWLNNDKKNEVTDSATIEMVSDLHEERVDEDSSAVILPAVTYMDGLAALEQVLFYTTFSSNQRRPPSETLLLRRWHYISAKKRPCTLKQKTLDSFF